MSNKELVFVSLQGIPLLWEAFITTISITEKFLTFDELVDKCTQEETKIISRGIIEKHEKGEPSTFVSQDKEMEGRGRLSNSINPSLNSKDSNRILRKIECYNSSKRSQTQIFDLSTYQLTNIKR